MSEVPAAAPVSAENPGKGLGIVGLILSILPFLQLIGFIVSLVARSKSKKAGFKNGFATAGIIISLIGIIITIAVIVFGAIAAGNLAAVCAEYGSGVWETSPGVEITCP